MEVKIKDRKEEIEYIRIVLNIAGIGVDYTNADLINRVMKELNNLKGKFSVSDGVTILYKWKEDWQNYFEEQSKTQDAS